MSADWFSLRDEIDRLLDKDSEPASYDKPSAPAELPRFIPVAISHYHCVKFNVPAWYKNEQFCKWLTANAATGNQSTDAFIWYDMTSQSDSSLATGPEGFPKEFWAELVLHLGTNWFGVVWLTSSRE